MRHLEISLMKVLYSLSLASILVISTVIEGYASSFPDSKVPGIRRSVSHNVPATEKDKPVSRKKKNSRKYKKAAASRAAAIQSLPTKAPPELSAVVHGPTATNGMQKESPEKDARKEQKSVGTSSATSVSNREPENFNNKSQLKEGFVRYLMPPTLPMLDIRFMLQQSIDNFSDALIDEIWTCILPDVVSPLTSINPRTISSGLYNSDNMELILSTLLANFGPEDIIVFDVDEVLITGLDSFYFAHCEKRETPLSKRLFSQDESIIDKFFLYVHLSRPWSLIDEKLPALIKRLQAQGIKCIANTATDTTVNDSLNIDVPTSRVKTLRSFGIDFSVAFPHLPRWNFDTLKSTYVSKMVPMFKDGIIFSPTTPKCIPLLELFNRLNFRPRRVGFLDDFLHNAQPMYEALTAQGIECYSFLFSKKHSYSSRSYFSREVFDQSLIKLEVFLEKLLGGENVDAFFRKLSAQ